jgi:UDP-3-O-[3-hydroxymyristoyl] glucosamine N-acyltransferase
VTDLVLIGAGKFSLEVARWIDDITASGQGDYRVRHHLVVAGEAVHAPAPLCLPLETFDPPTGTRVVLALSDVPQRIEAVDGFITKHGLVAENIVHPSTRVDAAAIDGVGNIIGPNCYIGVNVRLGSYNVLNYYCTVGHHSRIGSNNFIAPNFNCGNTVTIGDGNLFGLSCTLGPEVTVGDDSAFQAGIDIFEDTVSGCSYLVPSRIKMIKRV